MHRTKRRMETDLRMFRTLKSIQDEFEGNTGQAGGSEASGKTEQEDQKQDGYSEAASAQPKLDAGIF